MQFLGLFMLIINLLLLAVICGGIVYLFILLVKALKKYLKSRP